MIPRRARPNHRPRRPRWSTSRRPPGWRDPPRAASRRPPRPRAWTRGWRVPPPRPRETWPEAPTRTRGPPARAPNADDAGTNDSPRCVNASAPSNASVRTRARPPGTLRPGATCARGTRGEAEGGRRSRGGRGGRPRREGVWEGSKAPRWAPSPRVPVCQLDRALRTRDRAERKFPPAPGKPASGIEGRRSRPRPALTPRCASRATPQEPTSPTSEMVRRPPR